MMTSTEVALLMERRVAALRWTIEAATIQLARLEAELPRRNHGSALEKVPQPDMERG